MQPAMDPFVRVETMKLVSGSKVGPYEIIALIGAGGMGEVYKAVDIRLGRSVAVKVLPEIFARDEDDLRLQFGMVFAFGRK